jgi:hypothetical protein
MGAATPALGVGPAVPATPVARDRGKVTRSMTAARRLMFGGCGGQELTGETCPHQRQLSGGESAAEFQDLDGIDKENHQKQKRLEMSSKNRTKIGC